MINKKETYLFIHKEDMIITDAYEKITNIEKEKYTIEPTLKNTDLIAMNSYKGCILSIIKDVNPKQKNTFETCFFNKPLVCYKLKSD